MLQPILILKTAENNDTLDVMKIDIQFPATRGTKKGSTIKIIENDSY